MCLLSSSMVMLIMYHSSLFDDGTLCYSEPQSTIQELRQWVENTTWEPVLHDRYQKLNMTLTRLGTEINFDERTCPPGSLRATFSIPYYSDCPTLFIVGARKGGTTSLYQYVSKHPNFTGIKLDMGPMAGEMSYFSTQNYCRKGSWKKYQRMFPNGSMSGDSSVANLVHCSVPQRIFRSCGKKAKIVMLLRNPIDRIRSNYLMRARFGTTVHHNLTEAVKWNILTLLSMVKIQEIINVSQTWEKFLCLFKPSSNMIFEGLYYVHLHNWLCNFPRENIMVMNSEEFFANPSQSLRQIFGFVGLNPLDEGTLMSFTSEVYNQGRYNDKDMHSYQLSDWDRKMLLTVYKPFNEALFDLLNWNTDWNSIGQK